MDKLDTLLQKEISRREFLGLVATAFVSIVGVSALLKNFSSVIDRHTSSPAMSTTYGGSPYGGKSNNQV